MDLSGSRGNGGATAQVNGPAAPAMPALVSEYLAVARAAVDSSDSESLARLLAVHPDAVAAENSATNRLRYDLYNWRSGNITDLKGGKASDGGIADAAVDTIPDTIADQLMEPLAQIVRNTFDSDQLKPFCTLFTAYLEFLVRSIDAGMDEWIPRLSKTFNALYSIFASFQQPNDWIWPAICAFAMQYCNLAILADTQAEDKHFSSMNEAARMLFRMFSSALSDRQPTFSGKKRCILRLANCLFKLYFKTNQVRLCSTIHVNTSSSGDFSFSNYNKSDQVSYRYYMGRYFLQQYQIHEAFEFLSEAFKLCRQDDYSHRRKILIYLIPSALIIGLSPHRELILQRYNLEDHFGPLIGALRHGDHKQFYYALNSKDRAQWFISNGTYLLLADRCQILLFRNLFRRTFLATYIPEQRTTFVEGKKLLQAYQWIAKRDGKNADILEDLDLADIECICVNLLDQGYIKGYIMHNGLYLVLKKDDRSGFQEVSEVRPAVFAI